MPPIFLDSGYLVALVLVNDQHHKDAINHWQTVRDTGIDFVTTSLVMSEAVTLINSRGRHDKAVTAGNMLLHGSDIRMIFVDEPLLMEGWNYFKRHDDKMYSLADCVSFVVMERYDICTAYAFDRDFNQAGFIMEPTHSR